MRWTVVIPAKALPAAKSRLLPASADITGHGRLVRAIRADTLAAASAAEGVARVVVVTDRAAADIPARIDVLPADGVVPRDGVTPGVLLTVVQSAPGLNAALTEAAAMAARRWPDDGVAALVGDLPALRPADLADALRAAATEPRMHVPDAAGTGTTLLTARPQVALRPSFGPGSAARHAAASVVVHAAPSLRHDVDTAADLRAAALVGLGPATVAELEASGNLGEYALLEAPEGHACMSDGGSATARSR